MGGGCSTPTQQAGSSPQSMGHLMEPVGSLQAVALCARSEAWDDTEPGEPDSGQAQVAQGPRV